MKNWLSISFGSGKSETPADRRKSGPPRADAEQTVATDAEWTVLVSTPHDLQAVSVREMLGGVYWPNGTAAPELLKHLDEVRVEGVGISEPPPELQTLQNPVYGWLNPDGVGQELERLATEWQSARPMPLGTQSLIL
jgi:hypothetical protein